MSRGIMDLQEDNNEDRWGEWGSLARRVIMHPKKNGK